MTGTPPHAPLLYRAESPRATEALAEKIAQVSQPGDLITLDGDLGAGKSHFARAFIRALCGAGIAVPSPTFALIQSYDGPSFPLHHFDLYRLEAPEELEELGLWDALDTGLCLIEWPDRAAGLLPQTGLRIAITPGDTDEAREIALTAGPGWTGRRAALEEMCG